MSPFRPRRGRARCAGGSPGVPDRTGAAPRGGAVPLDSSCGAPAVRRRCRVVCPSAARAGRRGDLSTSRRRWTNERDQERGYRVDRHRFPRGRHPTPRRAQSSGRNDDVRRFVPRFTPTVVLARRHERVLGRVGQGRPGPPRPLLGGRPRSTSTGTCSPTRRTALGRLSTPVSARHVHPMRTRWPAEARCRTSETRHGLDLLRVPDVEHLGKFHAARPSRAVSA